MKQCTKCKKSLPQDDENFYRSSASKDGYVSRCKPCLREYDRTYRAEHPERVQEIVQKKLQKQREDPVRLARKRLSARRYELKQYGLTPAEYDLRFEEQHGLCAICGNPTTGTLSVDHDHITGEVRGLLCQPCNVALARVEAVLGWCSKAEGYLAKHRQKASEEVSVSTGTESF
jgi:hypothetical protein